MDELEQKLNYKFTNRVLLETALSHSSYANENKRHGAICNERLEFLGDSVLGQVVATYLYLSFPNMPEGNMTRLRAELVCEGSLYGVAKSLDFGKFLKLGKGEENSGGRERESILADAVEAVIAAMYLDGGLDVAKEFIHRNILDKFDANSPYATSDYKTELQEEIQRKPAQVLTYKTVSESGPDHNKTFTVEVYLNDKAIGSGKGHTKKEAEQLAAKSGLESLLG